ncbi:hypothetical protein [uncultured Bacteroides sp.]|uniref:hypothetical protein n=1 Tax=uncultured Bacteroides sp. TaxID=162156 RepID=UPI002AAB0C8E|nr:hypothetical protein [uncultured Bacteroides sp.]
MNYKERLISLFLCVAGIATSLQVSGQEKVKTELGGALRFNYNYSDWKPSNRKQGGQWGFDVFRINVNSTYKKLLLNAEYRFYSKSSGGGMLKHGWAGYKFDDHNQIQVGLTGLPFGLLPYTSNSYFFNINYYLGLEDDADMGIKYLYSTKKWDLALAFFKNADVTEFGSTSESTTSRYGYDVGGRNKETNQVNARVVYHFGNSIQQQVGLSGMYGGLYNIDTEEMGSHYAFAAHYEATYKRWNLKAQYSNFNKKPHNKEGVSNNMVAMAAYGALYNVASRGETYLASLSYTLPIKNALLQSIRFYNDFSMFDKHNKEFKDSYQNVTGCMLSMGPVYTYVDYALGKNHAWLGSEWNEAFAAGSPSSKWNARFNINMGYYF